MDRMSSECFRQRWSGRILLIAMVAVSAACADPGTSSVEVPPVVSTAVEEEPVTTVPDTTLIPAREGAFVPAPSMTGWCAWCMALVLEDGRVLVLGGIDGQRVIAEIYDPATSTFSVAGRLIYDYPGNTGDAALLRDGRVLLVGVANDGGSARAEIFDPATGESRAIDREGPVGAEAVGLADGRVLVIGEGLIGDGEAPALLFDPATEAFTETGPMQHERQTEAAATLLDDGRVLVVGGAPVGAAEIFDPKTSTFTPTGSLNAPRDGFTATPLSDGTVLIVGGSDEAGTTMASAEVFDPETGIFGITGSMATARFWHTAASLPDGRVLVIGGNDGQGGAQEQTPAEVYNPHTRRFSPAPPPIRPRQASTAVTLPTGVLVVGQYPGNDPTASHENGYTAEVFTLTPFESSEG